VVAIIVIIILFFIARKGMKKCLPCGEEIDRCGVRRPRRREDCADRDGDRDRCGERRCSWYESLHMYRWGRCYVFWAIVMVIGILLFSWAAYMASSVASETNKKSIIGAVFGLSMLGLIAMFAAFFRRNHDDEPRTSGFTTAFWLAFALVVLAVVAVWAVWESMAARIAMIVYVVFVIMVAILLWDMSRYYNREGCCEEPRCEKPRDCDRAPERECERAPERECEEPEEPVCPRRPVRAEVIEVEVQPRRRRRNSRPRHRDYQSSGSSSSSSSSSSRTESRSGSRSRSHSRSRSGSRSRSQSR
jgi:uncharacterized membrane protein YhaH (DUF805 family)